MRWRFGASALSSVQRALFALAVAAALLFPSAALTEAKGEAIAPGYDLFETPPGQTSFSFGSDTAIPAGFFGSGSEPVTGTVPLMGVPLGYFHGHAVGATDTIVHRIDPVTLPATGGNVTIPIEIVQLHLQSVQPITVHFNNGTVEPWMVDIDLSPHFGERGGMTIHGGTSLGGTFDSTIPVVPRFTFSRVGAADQKVLDVGTLPPAARASFTVPLASQHVHYTYSASGRLIAIRGLNKGFCAGCDKHGNSKNFVEHAARASHLVHAATKLRRVPDGFDLFQTDPADTKFSVPSSTAIPAGFFGPGSKPFSGDIRFNGNPIGTFHGIDVGDADTVVQRRRPADLSHKPQATIPIELVMLSLQSVHPITVNYSGHPSERWNVTAAPSPSAHSTGKMTIRKRNESGGTFDSQFSVFPKLIFRRVSDGVKRELDVGAKPLRKRLGARIVFRAKKTPWQRGCRGEAMILPRLSNSFCPALGNDGKKVLNEEQARLAAHGVNIVQRMRIPLAECVSAPSLELPQGHTGQATCRLRRTELKDSFFDIVVALHAPAQPIQGVTIKLTGPKTTLRRGEQAPLQIKITAASDAPPGPHSVPVKLTRSAGAHHIDSFFDVFVQVDSSNPVTNGGGTFTANGGFPNSVFFQGGFNQATTGFTIRVPGGRQVQNSSQVNGYTCAVETGTTTNDQLHCTGNKAANTPINARIDMNSPPSSMMGGQLFGFQGAAEYGPFTISGPS